MMHGEREMLGATNRQQRTGGERGERKGTLVALPTPTPDRLSMEVKFELLYLLLRRDTDGGVAEWFLALYGPDVLFVVERQQWALWDGRRWLIDNANAVRERVKAAIQTIVQMIPFEADPSLQQAMLKLAHRYDNVDRVKKILEFASTKAGVAKSVGDFDGEPYYLNCANGTLDLRTGTLMVPQREHMLNKVLDIQYDAAAKAPTWLAFLERIMPAGSAVIAFLQRAVGYSLTAETKEHKFFLAYGSGRNGKSTFIETVLSLLGEYAQSSNPETWLRQSGGRGAEPDIARLPGVRMVATAEIGEGRSIDEPRVKAIVAGDRTTTRDLYRTSFDFTPVCKLWISTNHAPQIRGNDEGMWRRVCMVPFDETIAYEEMDRDLPRKLRAEMPGILAWAVRGCIAWQRDGLLEPDVVRARTSEYRSDQDVLGQFIDECCAVDPAARQSASALATAYADWARQRGERRSFSSTAFGRRLAERGFGAEKIGGRIYRLGIALRHLEVGDGAY